MPEWHALEFSPGFLRSILELRLSQSDVARLEKALTLLAVDERHPSLRVHRMKGRWEGTWTASASDALRIRFERLRDGRKLLVDVTRHYDR